MRSTSEFAKGCFEIEGVAGGVADGVAHGVADGVAHGVAAGVGRRGCIVAWIGHENARRESSAQSRDGRRRSLPALPDLYGVGGGLTARTDF